MGKLGTPLYYVYMRAQRNIGFLSGDDLDILAQEDRLRLVLLRFGGCRCTCPAQDARHIIEGLTAIGDYLRDISLQPHEE